MKQILIALLIALATCSLVNAQNQITAQQDSTGKVKVTVSKSNNGQKGINTAVTVVGIDAADSIDAYADSVSYNQSTINFPFDTDDVDSGFHHFGDALGGGIIVAIIAIISAFGFPVFVLFLIFFFRYKNRKARYRLAEQALASGQPLPEGILRESKSTDQRSSGIGSTFTGIGLFIFLWAITGEFGIGAIGLLVMFMGIGQWIVGYQRDKKNAETEKANQEWAYQNKMYQEKVNERNISQETVNEGKANEEKNEEIQ